MGGFPGFAGTSTARPALEMFAEMDDFSTIHSVAERWVLLRWVVENAAFRVGLAMVSVQRLFPVQLTSAEMRSPGWTG